jgi:hypothetical protein
LKASSATSARATPAPRATGRSSGRHPPTRTSAEGFALSGPSQRPDPQFNAYRQDLADVALAGTVIASHYAEPVRRAVKAPATLRSAPTSAAEPVGALASGDDFLMLDDSLGWAWGYAGAERRVGYVESDALGLAKH